MTVMNIVSYEYGYLDTYLSAAQARVEAANEGVEEANRRLGLVLGDLKAAQEDAVALVDQLNVVKRLAQDLTANADVLEIAQHAVEKAEKCVRAESSARSAAYERLQGAEAVLDLRQAEFRLLQLADAELRG